MIEPIYDIVIIPTDRDFVIEADQDIIEQITELLGESILQFLPASKIYRVNPRYDTATLYKAIVDAYSDKRISFLVEGKHLSPDEYFGSSTQSKQDFHFYIDLKKPFLGDFRNYRDDYDSIK